MLNQRLNFNDKLFLHKSVCFYTKFEKYILFRENTTFWEKVLLNFTNYFLLFGFNPHKQIYHIKKFQKNLSNN